MEGVKKFLSTHGYFLGILIILIFAIIFRTYNFQERIGTGGDSGRDAMIALVALDRGELPLFASFSSAGPFVFGPLFYWYNMSTYLLAPFTFEAPWIITCMIGILVVMAMTYIGYLVGGKKMSIVLGFLVAFSPQFIARSTFLSQHGFVGVSCTLLLLFFILYIQKKRIRYAFLMGLSVGIAISMHYQALNLLLFLAALLLIPKTSLYHKLLAFSFGVLGFIIPTLPLLYWDSHQDFANLRNLLDYMLIGQYRIYVANSWKIYLYYSLPDYWSNVVGGNKPIAIILMALSGITFIYRTITKKIPLEIFLTGIILGIFLIIIRYYRGERFEGYLIYTAPFIFLITGWTLLQLSIFISYTTNKIFRSREHRHIATFFFFVVFSLILFFDLVNARQFIFGTNLLNDEVKSASILLMQKYPNKKFALYDYKWKTSGDTYALSLYLHASGKAKTEGYPIGIIGNTSASIDKKVVVGTFFGHTIVDLGKHRGQLNKDNWTRVNPQDVYDDLITRWTKNQKLTSSFSLDTFILERLKIF